MNLKHQYLMNISPDDWNNLEVIKNKLDTPFSQLMREGLRHIVKQKLETISQRRKTTESLSNIGSI